MKRAFILVLSMLLLISCESIDEAQSLVQKDEMEEPQRVFPVDFEKGELFLKRVRGHESKHWHELFLRDESGDRFLAELDYFSFVLPQYLDDEGAFYYLAPASLSENELALFKYVLNLGESEQIESAGEIDLLADFFVDGDFLYVLSGICSEGAECSLLKLDVNTGEREVLVSELETSRMGVVQLVKSLSDSDVLSFAHRSGDGPVAAYELYEYDLLKKDWGLVESNHSYGNCTEERLNSDEFCTEEVLAGNEAFLKGVERMLFVPGCSNKQMLSSREAGEELILCKD